MAGTIFNFGRANHLGWVTVVSDDDYDLQIGTWISGRVLGKYISWFIPRRDQSNTLNIHPDGPRR